MSNIRKELVVISFAVPVKAKKLLDKRVELEGFDCQSDMLRRILMQYFKECIPAEDYAEIVAEIDKMEANRL